jgi:hypothetical protein
MCDISLIIIHKKDYVIDKILRALLLLYNIQVDVQFTPDYPWNRVAEHPRINEFRG